MKKFKYRALKNNTKIIEGEIEASDLRVARQLIRNLGFLPIKIYTEDTDDNVNSYQVEQVVDTRVRMLSLSQKILFTSNLETFLSAGIPILEALQTVESNSSDVKIKSICTNVRNKILSGATFAQALKSMYENVFGAIYTGLVKTGEDAGELEITLQRLLIMLRKQEVIKDKIINASIYPSVLILMLLGVLILFSKYVFPKFTALMTLNGAELPLLAQSLVGMTSFVGNFWWFILIILGAIYYLITNLFKNPKIKSKWDSFVLKIPVISDFITYINLSNFMTVMHIAYDAGVPILAGLELASKTVGNNIIKSKIFTSINLVRSGKSLTEAFKIFIPSALNSMVSTGEKSGSLGKMFKDCADVIDKKVDMTLDAMVKLFEPTVILIMGGAVLFIALAFMQAYSGLLGSFF